MLREALLVCCTVALLDPAARASDITQPGGGTFAQIMDQGAARTTFTLTNLDPTPAPYTISFYKDDGTPLALSTTAASSPAASLTGSIPVNGSVEFATNGPASSTLVQGYAVLVTQNTIAGSAVFGLPIGNGFFESTCPLDTGTDFVFGIPFDHTVAGTVVGVALANAYGYAPLTINVTAYDQSGNKLATTPVNLANGAHTAFLLTSQFPALAGKRGTIWFTGADSGGNQALFNVLGVRATNTTYTSIVPIVPPNE
jgi:hypothetical protein